MCFYKYMYIASSVVRTSNILDYPNMICMVFNDIQVRILLNH